MRRALGFALAASALGAATLVLARAFVAGVYRVDSASMEPTIHGAREASAEHAARSGERVLVRYAREPEPQRFDLVVVQRPGEERPIVKRVVGLPGESLRVVAGDVLVQGTLLGADVARPPWVALFDSALHRIEDAFWYQHCEHDQGQGWLRSAAGFELRGLQVAPDSDAGLLLYHDALSDGWIGPEGERVRGMHAVNDARVAGSFLLRELGAQARVRLRLVEEADTFETHLVPDPARKTLRVELQRWSSGERRRPLDLVEVDFEVGREHSFEFSNRDNRLEFWLDGARLATAAYEANEPYRGEAARGRKSVGAGVGLGAECANLCLLELRVARDLAYQPIGRFGVESAVVLGPDEYFLLGDNSADSADSRSFGPIARRYIVGFAEAILWPRPRWLEAREAGD